ncbi:hypothetical protein Cgig2_003352 [Carnegiea gigantea]|uniref:Aspergillus nuclease S1 n=1 Tax=Carnegiea gigantea TaxID=171969 RepID=A0A9Q1K1W1_9CARY|nr:hypothetical protein Cgig2_003352 [Carnegiea gigantea]
MIDKVGDSATMSPSFRFVFCCLICFFVAGAQAWSKEGHIITCRIAQNLLEPEAAHAVKNLLPENLDGDLSALCVWPDQVRHWYKYRWTSPLHFIDTPDNACTFDYNRDCIDHHTGAKDMCIAGAIQNFTSQLQHYREGTSDRRYNLTEALLFLSHFMGDIHQVWDREIILTAMKDYYDKDMDLMQQDIEGNFTDGIWSDDVESWTDCNSLHACVTKYATESINIACKWGYKGVEPGVTLAGKSNFSHVHFLAKMLTLAKLTRIQLSNRYEPKGIRIRFRKMALKLKVYLGSTST